MEEIVQCPETDGSEKLSPNLKSFYDGVTLCFTPFLELCQSFQFHMKRLGTFRKLALDSSSGGQDISKFLLCWEPLHSYSHALDLTSAQSPTRAALSAYKIGAMDKMQKKRFEMLGLKGEK
jgi:hypothetical protein